MPFLLLHTRALLLRHYALLALTPLLQPFDLLSRPSTPSPTLSSPLLSRLYQRKSTTLFDVEDTLALLSSILGTHANS
jgi:hypothetical protein